MSWMCMNKPIIRWNRWCALTKIANNLLMRFECQLCHTPVKSHARTPNTSVMVPRTCSWSLSHWRPITVTDRRTRQDFAHQIRFLVDTVYPQATCIHLVLDNLNTHSAPSLYETFP